MTGIDGHRNRADRSYSCFQLLLVSGFYVDDATNCGADVRRSEMTPAIFARVRIRGFSVDAVVVFDVLKGAIRETSVATVVAEAPRAVDQVLFREGYQLFRFPEMLAFQGARLKQIKYSTYLDC